MGLPKSSSGYFVNIMTRILRQKTVESCSNECFAAAVDILIRKPHALNLRVAGAVLVGSSKCDINDPNNLLERQPNFGDVSDDANDEHLLEGSCRIVRKLIAKRGNVEVFEEVLWLISDEEASVTFLPEKTPSASLLTAPLQIRKQGDELSMLTSDTVREAQLDWLSKCFEKVIVWCGEEQLKSSLPSLRLVHLSDYVKKYQYLKDKYAKEIIENWTEGTNAEKFVHEDFGIAAYLMLLWELDSQSKPSFADLGCGNGLLVYILSREGYRGTGFDVRKRKIWDAFISQGADLRTETVVPCLDSRFDGFDWLIGNHSDELTPWIPVMATLTSDNTKFFVLPCCPFGFTGKFQRRTEKPRYRDYLDYVKEVGESCGFVMEEDKLRIPSTKRICFVGRSRKASSEPRHQLLDRVRSMVKEQSTTSFAPRPADIPVKNCTRLPGQVKSDIVRAVAAMCLEQKAEEVEGEGWNAGGLVSLAAAAAGLPKDLTGFMKSECGGLQTLLRNHDFVFVVLGGHVRLRCYADPSDLALRRAKKRKCDGKATVRNSKTKLCWFHENHPQGCSLPKEGCPWAHGSEDLQLVTPS